MFNSYKKEFEEQLNKYNILNKLIGTYLHETSHAMTHLGYSIRDVISNKDGLPRQLKEKMKSIENDSHRLKSLFSTLLDIYRLDGIDSSSDFQDSDITLIVDSFYRLGESNQLLTKRATRNFNIIHNSSAKHLYVPCQPSKVRHAFLNVLLNSIEANTRFDEIEVSIDIHENQDNIAICFTDNCVGIDASIIDNVFEAGFTTKKNHLGMGLAVAKNIVEEHNGQLTIQSDENKTEVIFNFPKSKELR